jgi:hypothetical protein
MAGTGDLKVDLKVKKGTDGGSPVPGQDRPRSGAAKGQGAGMGGYNSAAVNKAMGSVKGGGGKPTYYAGAGMGLKNK